MYVSSMSLACLMQVASRLGRRTLILDHVTCTAALNWRSKVFSNHKRVPILADLDYPDARRTAHGIIYAQETKNQPL